MATAKAPKRDQDQAMMARSPLVFSIFAVLAAAAAAFLLQDDKASLRLWQRGGGGGGGGGPDDNSPRCRCFPGDACWPSDGEWDDFNRTLGGKLVATVPIASVCHDNHAFAPYDADACARLQAAWDVPDTHYVGSSSPMAPFFANMSCDPFTPRDAQCVVGAYVRYAVNASSARDYQLTLGFAREKNVRLVVRNTGHDYYGKSTGAGGLAIWTRHLSDISIDDYSSSFYTGKAMKMGAGVMGGDAQAAAHAQGLIVVTGGCPSVGLAGGYTQGGGHGNLASAYGLGADQVLEWEVVTTEGKHLVASPTENTDLYWALSGGGGGTYGVVLSMTVKAYPDTKTAAAQLMFTSEGVSADTFYDGLKSFLANLSGLTDAGVSSVFMLGDGAFVLQPVIGPGLSKEELQALLQPTLDKLDGDGVTYSFQIDDYPTYVDADTAMGPEYKITEYNIGGRFIPRSITATDTVGPLTDAFRFIVTNGGVMSGLSVNVARNPPVAPNSVHPAWRETVLNTVVGTPYDQLNMSANLAGQQLVTDVLVPRLAALTPGGSCYGNEGDLHQPDFQEVFYGSNYARLKSIKEKYDPHDILYGLTAVGSENWRIESDGRLCKAH